MKLTKLNYKTIAGENTSPDTAIRVQNLSKCYQMILCSGKNAAVARYSVLKDSQQLFAAKYQFTLPSEDELQREILCERALIENQQKS